MRVGSLGRRWVLVVLVLRAEEVVQDVDDCRDVPLGLAVAILQSGVQSACAEKRERVSQWV